MALAGQPHMHTVPGAECTEFALVTRSNSENDAEKNWGRELREFEF